MATGDPEALKLLSIRDDVRAVVTDVQMPGDPAGLGLTRAFRERCPGLFPIAKREIRMTDILTVRASLPPRA